MNNFGEKHPHLEAIFSGIQRTDSKLCHMVTQSSISVEPMSTGSTTPVYLLKLTVTFTLDLLDIKYHHFVILSICINFLS